MKTSNKLSASSLRCGVAALAIALCASAFAGANSDAPNVPRHVRHQARKICYVQLSNTSFPQPCDRFVGGLPSTASPMVIIGELPVVREVRR